ncbi:hypothetical protein CKO51_13275 [Rhodopirellula sp. SM50]|nr:hypothetical protein CKO51_13275 [Rhodopirellula sp. SM50]
MMSMAAQVERFIDLNCQLQRSTASTPGGPITTGATMMETIAATNRYPGVGRRSGQPGLPADGANQDAVASENVIDMEDAVKLKAVKHSRCD